MAVPSDARIQPEIVQGYLEKLAINNLIDREHKDGDYRIGSDTSTILVRCSEMLKTPDPNIDEFLFHGFRVYSAWETSKQMACEQLESKNFAFNH